MFSKLVQFEIIEMQFLHSAILDKEEKMILKDALFLYVSDLQKRYYGTI